MAVPSVRFKINDLIWHKIVQLQVTVKQILLLYVWTNIFHLKLSLKTLQHPQREHSGDTANFVGLQIPPLVCFYQNFIFEMTLTPDFPTPLYLTYGEYNVDMRVHNCSPWFTPSTNYFFISDSLLLLLLLALTITGSREGTVALDQCYSKFL